MTCTQRTNDENLAMLAAHDARQDQPGLYEWTRENGTAVTITVSATGAIVATEHHPRTAEATTRPPLQADTFELACRAVEALMAGDTVR
jgi:hypothetical protein